METTLEYLVRKHSTLKNDYKMPDGNFVESCSIIALEVARRLLEEGKSPYIISFRDDTSSIKPRIYSERVTWGAHIVCCENDLAYDPMLGQPYPLKKYTYIAFGRKVHSHVMLTKEKTKQKLSELASEE